MKTPVITSLGLVSCIGHDVVTACAAQRAGLVQRAPLSDHWTYDEGELEIRVTGAPIQGLTNGFIQTGNWVRLALACLEDLVRYGRLPPPEDTAFWQETGLLWVLPELSFDRFGWPEPETPMLLEEFCGQLLSELSRIPLQLLPDSFIPTGPMGAAAALQRISRLAGGSAPKRVVVMASDSWLDRLSMSQLVREGRLKAGSRATGLCPGEASACVLVEDASLAQRRGAQAESCVLGAATQPAPEALDEEDPTASRVKLAPAIARNLARAVEEVLAAARLSQPFRGDILLDLNGENWKSMVWGHAQPMLANHVEFAGCRQHFPASSFGDIGAASGVAALCLATRAFVRGYALAEQTLICSISDDGGTGALLLSPPAPR